MCHGYRNLTSADREITHIAQSLLCDNALVSGWYRFTGDAGTRMAATCPNFSLGACATLRQGWLNGTHPKTEDGQVVRKVCFRYETCCSQTVHITVKNYAWLTLRLQITATAGLFISLLCSGLNQFNSSEMLPSPNWRKTFGFKER